MSDRPSSTGASREELRLLWKMSALAFQFGTEIIAGVLIGWGVDAYFGTRPWGVLIGSLIGIAVGTMDLIRRAIKLNNMLPAPKSPGASSSSRWKPPSGTDAEPENEDVIDPDFEESLSHEQWKALRNRTDDRDDARDRPTDDR